MKIYHCKVNGLSNPIGFEFGETLRFTRAIEGTCDRTLDERLQIALDSSFTQVIYDEVHRAENKVRYVKLPLSSRTRYFWRITISDEHGNVWAESPINFFETAKMDEPWTGKWISPIRPSRHPIIKKTFCLEGKIERARIYICGLGLYRLSINGKPVDDTLFNPHFTSYDKWIQYQTYDVGALLREGENTVEVLLGKGWYMGEFGLSGKKNVYGSKYFLLAEIVVEGGDEKKVIGTDESWQAELSHVTESGIYYGEDVDLRLPTESVKIALCGGPDTQIFCASRSLPVKIKQILKPEIIECPNGDRLLDFKQNAVGFIRMNISEPAGREIRLEFAEVLCDGNFYRENYRSARSEYRVVSDGTARVIEPNFTFFGFRYVRVSGVEGLRAEDFVACVVYSDFEKTGSIETSNEKINRLIANAEWGLRGNSLDLPTDCPQRNERLGWTGDCQAISKTALYSFDMAAFYEKWLYEMSLAQRDDGGIPDVVPPVDFGGWDAAAWGDAAAIVPWHVYLFGGDRELLKHHYPMMKKWVEHLREISGDPLAPRRNLWEYGDWLALDHPKGLIDPEFHEGLTDFKFLAKAYFAYSAEILSKAAEALDEHAAADGYRDLSQSIKRELWEHALAEPKPETSTQTAYAVGLAMNIVPKEKRAGFAKKMREKFHADGDVLMTGFVGTIFVLDALCDCGYEDLAVDLLLREEYPGWLYCVNLGATTIWERWNSLMPDGSPNKGGMNSYNHYAYGMVVGWMYSRLAGIQPIEVGFERVRIQPLANKKLPRVHAKITTPFGTYESGYRFADSYVEYTVSVPLCGEADVVIKDARPEQMGGDIPFEACADGVRAVVKAGSYTFKKKL